MSNANAPLTEEEKEHLQQQQQITQNFGHLPKRTVEAFRLEHAHRSLRSEKLKTDVAISVVQAQNPVVLQGFLGSQAAMEQELTNAALLTKLSQSAASLEKVKAFLLLHNAKTDSELNMLLLVRNELLLDSPHIHLYPVHVDSNGNCILDELTKPLLSQLPIAAVYFARMPSGLLGAMQSRFLKIKALLTALINSMTRLAQEERAFEEEMKQQSSEAVDESRRSDLARRIRDFKESLRRLPQSFKTLMSNAVSSQFEGKLNAPPNATSTRKSWDDTINTMWLLARAKKKQRGPDGQFIDDPNPKSHLQHDFEHFLDDMAANFVDAFHASRMPLRPDRVINNNGDVEQDLSMSFHDLYSLCNMDVINSSLNLDATDTCRGSLAPYFTSLVQEREFVANQPRQDRKDIDDAINAILDLPPVEFVPDPAALAMAKILETQETRNCVVLQAISSRRSYGKDPIATRENRKDRFSKECMEAYPLLKHVGAPFVDTVLQLPLYEHLEAGRLLSQIDDINQRFATIKSRAVEIAINAELSGNNNNRNIPWNHGAILAAASEMYAQHVELSPSQADLVAARKINDKYDEMVISLRAFNQAFAQSVQNTLLAIITALTRVVLFAHTATNNRRKINMAKILRQPSADPFMQEAKAAALKNSHDVLINLANLLDEKLYVLPNQSQPTAEWRQPNQPAPRSLRLDGVDTTILYAFDDAGRARLDTILETFRDAKSTSQPAAETVSASAATMSASAAPGPKNG
jgi:hypothetical protein